MARKVENEKGFLILEVEKAELLKMGGMGVCDSCNSQTEIKGYYIAAMNRWHCTDCFNTWLAKAINYTEDRTTELRYFQHYSKLLLIEEI